MKLFLISESERFYVISYGHEHHHLSNVPSRAEETRRTAQEQPQRVARCYQLQPAVTLAASVCTLFLEQRQP